jgi:cysteine desulfurase
MEQNKHRIYLDYAATTPLDPAVIAVMHASASEVFGNASSVHSYGREAKMVLEQSRETIARSIGAEPGEVFFTSGGTEADNHALVGTAFAAKRKTGKSHLIVSSIEHHAILHCAEYLASIGFTHSVAPVGADGIVDPEAVRSLITPETCLISVMHVNNELGTIQPIEAIGTLARDHGIVFHTDAIQAIGKVPIAVRTLPAALLSLSAHKIYGPKGIGALVIRRGTDVDALLHGGAQERKQRAGTENIPLVAGFAKSVDMAVSGLDEAAAHTGALKALLLRKIQAAVGDIVVNGDPARTVPSILSVSLDGDRYAIDGEALLINMDLRGIAVSSGSACTSGSVQPSHVLQAMGRESRDALLTIRFSLGKFTTSAEAEAAADAFVDIALHAIVR